MNKAVIILLCVFASVKGEKKEVELNKNGCPLDYHIEMLLPHDKRCNLYYQCVYGQKVERECPLNLVFNKETNNCDWAWNTKCTDRNEIPADMSIVHSNLDVNVICAQEGSDDLLLPSEYCNKFNKCGERLAWSMDCPANTFYNLETQRCDWAHEVDCGDRVIAESGGNNGGNTGGHGHSDPSQAPAICAAEGSQNVLVAHEYCRKYYVCYEGLPVERECRSGTLYNPENGWCDWPSNVDCGDRIPESGGNDDNGGNGNTGGHGHSDPSQAPAICAAPGSQDVLVAHEICSKYYICHGGLPIAMNCPSGLLYKPENEWCDWPSNVDCGDRIQESGGNDDNGGNDNTGGHGHSDPSQAPAICAAEGSQNVLVAHEYCRKYYVCYEGLPVERECRSGTLYNPENGWCDWPSNVDCGDRINSVSGGENDDNTGGHDHSDPSQAPAICAAEGSQDVLVAHENCRKYYICHRGSPIAMNCTPGLFYNPENGWCDWPSNVDCGNREI